MLNSCRVHYRHPTGNTRDWESCERTTRPPGTVLDGVGIVAVLDVDGTPAIVLQKQYRPPVDKVTIEVPAGLIDEGETAEQAAVRELKEETGYVGTVTESSPVMFNGMRWCSSTHLYFSLCSCFSLFFLFFFLLPCSLLWEIAIPNPLLPSSSLFGFDSIPRPQKSKIKKEKEKKRPKANTY